MIKPEMIELHIIKRDNDEIKFLLLKRSDEEIYPGIWQMVTGSIMKDEKAHEAALRELKEETGLVPEKFWVVPQINSFYYPEKDSVFLIPVFIAEVGGKTAVSISNEHSEFRWVSRTEAVELLAWKGQREAVNTIYEYFNDKSPFLKFVEIK